MRCEGNDDAWHSRETAKAIKGVAETDNKEISDIAPALVVLLVRRKILELVHGLRSLLGQLLLELALEEDDADNTAVVHPPILLAKGAPKHVAWTAGAWFSWDAVDVERVTSKMLGPL